MAFPPLVVSAQTLALLGTSRDVGHRGEECSGEWRRYRHSFGSFSDAAHYHPSPHHMNPRPPGRLMMLWCVEVGYLLERLHTPVIIYTPGILFRRLVIMFLLLHGSKLHTQVFWGARLHCVGCSNGGFSFVVLNTTQWSWLEYVCPMAVIVPGGKKCCLMGPLSVPTNSLQVNTGLGHLITNLYCKSNADW